MPLDPDYPAERVAYILKDSGAGALLTTAGLAESRVGGTEFGGAVVRIDAHHPDLSVIRGSLFRKSTVGHIPHWRRRASWASI